MKQKYNFSQDELVAFAAQALVNRHPTLTTKNFATKWFYTADEDGAVELQIVVDVE